MQDKGVNYVPPIRAPRGLVSAAAENPRPHGNLLNRYHPGIEFLSNPLKTLAAASRQSLHVSHPSPWEPFPIHAFLAPARSQGQQK